jgi:hypothetical protein
MTPLAILVAVGALIPLTIAYQLWAHNRRLRRESYIRTFTLPPGLFEKLRLLHPQLSIKDCQLVAQGLRQFFLTYHKSSYRMVSMPSQVADDLWHAFILYTRHYQKFCDESFGRFLHHSPAVVLSGLNEGNAGLRRCWWYACKEENINPKQPSRLPLLFALDSKLHIRNGFSYAADCKGVRNTSGDGGNSSPYCGGDFSSSSIDGSTDGFGDASNSSSGISADSDGDSGGGDSGGGCGGGE